MSRLLTLLLLYRSGYYVGQYISIEKAIAETKESYYDAELFLKRTPTSDRLLAKSELRYPYEGSKTLMYVFDDFDDKALISELLNGMYAELPEKKPKKPKKAEVNR